MAKSFLILPLACALLAGCVEDQTTVVTAPPAQAAYMRVGTITAVRNVTVRQTNQGDQVAGAVVGGLAGAVIGHQFGSGSGRDVMTVAGAAAGATAGAHIAGKPTTRVSQEWTVRLDHGGAIAILQNSNAFYVGERVRVVREGDRTYLRPL